MITLSKNKYIYDYAIISTWLTSHHSPLIAYQTHEILSIPKATMLIAICIVPTFQVFALVAS